MNLDYEREERALCNGSFTLTGKELLRVARKKIYDLDYIKGVVASIKEHNTNIKLTLHKVNERLVDKVACDPQEIMV